MTSTTAVKSVKSVGNVVLAVALLATAVVVWLAMPNKLESWAPIQATGAVGERLDGRNMTVTVHDVLLTRELEFDSEAGPRTVGTEGVWLVADISFGTTVMFASPRFAVETGGRRFSPVVSGFPSLLGGDSRDLPAGFTTRAAVAFELPESPRAATVLAWCASIDQYGNDMLAPLDSQIAVPVEFGSGAVRAVVNLNDLGQS